jgi:hypothetical protein
MSKYLDLLKADISRTPLPRALAIKAPLLDSDGVPYDLCPGCGHGEFWRLPVFHPRHNARGWCCCFCDPISHGAGPCDFCGVPD